MEFLQSCKKEKLIPSFRDESCSQRNSRLRDSKDLPKVEFDELKILLKDKAIVLQKADKGNAFFILNRNDYVCRIINILNDRSKFQKINIKFTSLRDKREISNEHYNDSSLSGSRFGILYDLAKVHNVVMDCLPFFRPVLSVIGALAYKLAKFLVPMVGPLTIKDYAIKDSFSFAEGRQTFGSKLVMASLTSYL